MTGPCVSHTFSGRAFDFDACLRGEAVAVDFWDIAHALAGINRFGGHARAIYTVAQHSVLVSLRAEHLAAENRHPSPIDVAAAALMHDASEAYVGDMIRPLRRRPEMAFFRELEAAVAAAIARHFGLATDRFTAELVEQADNELLAVEARELLNPSSCPWADMAACPPNMRIGHAWEPADAYAAFARRAGGLSLLEPVAEGLAL